MIGFLLLMDRGESAQLRYFLIEPAYRGIGLGSRLMKHYMDFLSQCGYKKSYLWTTHELSNAASIYKRAGFQLTEDFENHLHYIHYNPVKHGYVKDPRDWKDSNYIEREK